MSEVNKNNNVDQAQTSENQANIIPYKPKRFEASKIILGIVLFICFVFAAIIIYGWLVLERTDSPLMLTAVLTPAGTAIGFHYVKSLKENEIKLKKIYGSLYIADFEKVKYQNNMFGGYGNYDYGYGNIGTDNTNIYMNNSNTNTFG